MELRDRIKTARKALGISQEALARRADVSLSLINQIERGVVVDPHYSTLVSIAEALSMSIGELLGEPVPLGEAPEEGLPADTENSYTAFEAFGQVLASRWGGELEAWEEKIPEGSFPDPVEFGQLIEWALDIDRTTRIFESIAQHEGHPMRRELADTLGMLQEAKQDAVRMLKRAFEPAKTYAEFKKIVEANDLEAILISAGRDA